MFLAFVARAHTHTHSYTCNHLIELELSPHSPFFFSNNLQDVLHSTGNYLTPEEHGLVLLPLPTGDQLRGIIRGDGLWGNPITEVGPTPQPADCTFPFAPFAYCACNNNINNNMHLIWMARHLCTLRSMHQLQLCSGPPPLS